jgi:hypothetical protein
MNFNEFAEVIESFEKPVVLLEGSRNVLEKDAESLINLADKLARKFPQAVFRSGAANGSDNLFAQGVLNVSRKRMQFVLPKSKSGFDKTNSFSFADLPESEQEDIFNLTVGATPKYEGLVDFYKKRQLGGTYYKTQFLLRDALKVCGSKSFQMSRADVGCFYVNSNKAGGGGTGHTIRVCKLLKVPVIEQTDWLKWL